MNVSQLPIGWKTVPLEQLLVSLESGQRPKGGVKHISYGIPSIGGEHINYDGTINTDNVKYVPAEFAHSLARGHIKKNDILIVKDGATTGKMHFVDDSFPYNSALVNEHVFLCKISTCVNPKYVFYFLWSEAGQKMILDNFKGIAQGGINRSFASSVLVPLPSLAMQNLIVSKLDSFCSKMMCIRERFEVIAHLETKLLRAFLSDVSKECLYPSDCVENYIIECNERIGKKFKGIKKIGVSTACGIINLRTTKKQSYEKYKVVYPGDIIYNTMRINIGSIAIYGGNEYAITSPDYTVFRTKNDFSGELLVRYLKSNIGHKQINNNTRGSVRSRLYFKSLSNIKMPIVPPQIQQQAEKLFKVFNGIKNNISNVNKQLESIKIDVLSRAFTGKLIDQSLNEDSIDNLLEKIFQEKRDTKLKGHKKTISRKCIMSRKSKESLRKTIKQNFIDSFTFEQLRDVLSWEYEDLKKIFFDLLSDSNTIISQVFDEEEEKIVFKVK